MPKPPAESKFEKLISDITELWQQAKGDIEHFAGQRLTIVAWHTGKEIVELEQDSDIKIKYGEQFVSTISSQLSNVLGKGFSESSIWRMKKFYEVHRKLAPVQELEWSKAQILLTIKDDQKRAEYEEKVIQEGWTKDELREKLAQDKIERESEEFSTKNTEQTTRKLKFKKGTLNLYSLKKGESKTDQTLRVDFGFNAHQIIDERLTKNFKDKDLVTVKTEGNTIVKIMASLEKRAALFTTAINLIDVVDGDTLKGEVVTPIQCCLRQKIRLSQIDCPEIRTQKGLEAKAFVENLLAECSVVVVRTHGIDDKGRYLGDVYFLPQETDPQIILEKGRFLNQEILDSGYARYWEMGEE